MGVRRRLTELAPLEDDADDPGIIDPVGIHLGGGRMRIHTCPTDPPHPHRLTFQ
ncbi:hypothetical protein [Streptomyces sp. NPDC007883]|uniref:hypothetical protein n=1 Tax=Streptomyces sp. NPDC007883 TaxID=3155116 RepID=UPI0033FD0A8C